MRSDATPESQHLAIYPAHLCELVARFGVSRARLLEQTGIDASVLDDPEGRVSDSSMTRLIMRALALTEEPGLGCHYGLQLKLSAHGAVGLAAMTSSTLGEAIQVGVRFVQLRAPHLYLKSLSVGTEVHWDFDFRARPGPLRIFLTEAHITGLAQMARMLVGRAVPGRVEVSHAEPAHFARLAHLFPGPISFGHAVDRLIMPREVLDLPLQLSDPFAAQRAIAECERALVQLAEASTLVSTVRRQLDAWPVGFPSLTELAEQRGASPRTLKRSLAANGTSYQRLLDEARLARALRMLADERHSIELIAAVLGYADPSNFHRAFRRLTGLGPTEWRARERR